MEKTKWTKGKTGEQIAEDVPAMIQSNADQKNDLFNYDDTLKISNKIDGVLSINELNLLAGQLLSLNLACTQVGDRHAAELFEFASHAVDRIGQCMSLGSESSKTRRELPHQPKPSDK